MSSHESSINLGSHNEGSQIQSNRRGFLANTDQPEHQKQIHPQLLSVHKKQKLPRCNAMHIEGFRRASLMRNFSYFKPESEWKLNFMYPESLIAWRKFQNFNTPEPQKKATQGNYQQSGRQTAMISLKSFNMAQNSDFQEDSPHLEQVRTALRRKSCTCSKCGDLSEKQKQTQDVKYIPSQNRKYEDVRKRVTNILDTPIRYNARNNPFTTSESRNNINFQQNSIQQTQSTTLISIGESPLKKSEIEFNSCKSAIQEIPERTSFSQYFSQYSIKPTNGNQTLGSKFRNQQSIYGQSKQIDNDSDEELSEKSNDMKNNHFIETSIKKRRQLPKIEGVLEKFVKEKGKIQEEFANFLKKATEKLKDKNCGQNQRQYQNQNMYSLHSVSFQPSVQVSCLELNEEGESAQKQKSLQQITQKSKNLVMETLPQFRDRYLKEFAGREAIKNFLMKGSNYNKLKKIKNSEKLQKSSVQAIKIQENQVQESKEDQQNLPKNSSSPPQKSSVHKKLLTIGDEINQRKNIIQKMLVFSESHSKVLQSPYPKKITNHESFFDNTLNKKSKFQNSLLTSNLFHFPKSKQKGSQLDIFKEKIMVGRSFVSSSQMNNFDQQEGQSSKNKSSILLPHNSRTNSSSIYPSTSQDQLIHSPNKSSIGKSKMPLKQLYKMKKREQKNYSCYNNPSFTLSEKKITISIKSNSLHSTKFEQISQTLNASKQE